MQLIQELQICYIFLENHHHGKIVPSPVLLYTLTHVNSTIFFIKEVTHVLINNNSINHTHETLTFLLFKELFDTCFSHAIHVLFRSHPTREKHIKGRP